MGSNILKHGINTILMILNVILSLVTIISAYSGLISPIDSAIFALLVMLYPTLALLTVMSLIALLIIKRWKIALIPILTLIATYTTAVTYFPLNITLNSEETTDSTFTMVTYNVMNFHDYQKEYESKEQNRTVQYILDMDADIVALQECYKNYLNDGSKKIPQKQLSKLKKQYPYRYYSKPDIAILSKYPTKDVVNKLPELNGGSAGAKIIKHPLGDITIIDVHLQSLLLQKEDKELYKEVTSLGRDDKQALTEVRTQLIDKLIKAFRSRAVQANMMNKYIHKLESKNLIVCGDFNDTPTSYAYRTIKGDMRDAYTQCAFWPTVTFHADRFYFRIDQIFYRGNINATSIKRGNQKSSDHYPLLTTFQFKQ